jgi:glycosyltransferase involved in cell wall biosynthesis
MGVPAVLTHHSMLGGAAGLLAFADRLIGWTRWRVLHTAVSPLVADDVRLAARRAARPRTLAVGILPNGIHPAAWGPSDARPAPAPAPGEFRVASVMRLSRRKRPQALLDVADRVRAGLPAGARLRVRVAGDGPERAAVEREIARRGLGDAVELLGFRPREAVRALFAESDAFVLPSILESFGIAALEARCAGVPVVALRAAGPAAFIRDGVEGLLADDDADLARQLLRLAADERLRAGIARHNRWTLPAETWPAVLARHQAAYADARRLARGLALHGPAARPAPRRPHRAAEASA